MPVYVMRVTFDNHLNESGHQTEYLEVEGITPSMADIEAIGQLSSLLNLQRSPLSKVSNLVTEVIPPDQAEVLVISSRPKPDGGFYTIAQVARENTLSLQAKR